MRSLRLYTVVCGCMRQFATVTGNLRLYVVFCGCTLQFVVVCQFVVVYSSSFWFYAAVYRCMQQCIVVCGNLRLYAVVCGVSRPRPQTIQSLQSVQVSRRSLYRPYCPGLGLPRYRPVTIPSTGQVKVTLQAILTRSRTPQIQTCHTPTSTGHSTAHVDLLQDSPDTDPSLHPVQVS